MASKLSALSRGTSPHSTFEFAKMNRPRTPDEREAADSDDAVKREVGSDKQLNDYINFLEMLRGERPSVAQATGDVTGDEPRESLSMESELSVSVEMAAAAYTGADGSSVIAAAHGELHAAVSGEFVGSDGARYEFEATVDVSVDVAVSISGGAPAQSDPLALDLNGDGEISLTDLTSGVHFDINADGRMDRTAFIGGGDGFLALDRDGNGAINDGRELFGDQRGAINGYAALAELDDDKNGIIDSRDSLFSSLLVASQNGSGEVQTASLAAFGVKSISLAYEQVNERAAYGNAIAQRGSYERADGSRLQTVDALLRYSTIG